MPAGGFKVFVDGQVLPAADINAYLMQGILVFDSEAARDAAIAGPDHGMFAFTTDTNQLWVYDGAEWTQYAGGASAEVANTPTGTYSVDNIDYAYFRFTASGTLTVTRAGLIDVLVVSGGAGGSGGSGSNYGTGGGSGGANFCTTYATTGSFAVVVGAGGAGGAAGAVGASGSPSHFGITSGTGLLRISGGLSSPGQGPAGVGGVSASGYAGGTNSGGGGGATAVGTDNGGPGGAGFTTTITGSSGTYGVGGDGGGTASGIAGAANTGNAGGAGRLNLPGGNGGSGIVIIRVRT